MDFGKIVNTALVKAGLKGFANSGMHNPHLHAQIAVLLSHVILPKLPMTLEQQLITPFVLAPQGMKGVLLHFNPNVELSSSGSSRVNPTGDNLIAINNPNQMTDTEQVLDMGRVRVRTVEVNVKIDRVMCIRRDMLSSVQHYPARFPDLNHFSYTRRGDNDVLIEFPTSGAWDNETLIIDIIPQFVYDDITSPIDIPANTASYLIVALAYELAVIYNKDNPILIESLRSEMGANTRKASQDMDDYTTSNVMPTERMNRFNG
jgi:hypothetical protein